MLHGARAAGVAAHRRPDALGADDLVPNPGAGDRGRASLWPNSPGFPEPTPVDGVCVPSRGEHAGTAPLDCTERCGDGVADPGEDSRRCPSDVEASAATTRARR